MRKITWYDFGNNNHNYCNVVDAYQVLNGKKIKVMLVHLSDRITEEEKKEWLKKFSNISFTTAYCQYAPEIKKDIVVVYPKTRKFLNIEE